MPRTACCLTFMLLSCALPGQAAVARNIIGLENLTNLDRLPPRGATVIALPMKVKGGSGGPTRAIALLPQQ